MKTQIGPSNCFYPMPTVLVGAMVNEKPNFITIAHLGIMDLNTVSISMNQEHYSCIGIKESGVFSVNVPTESMIREVDFCGLVSGDRTDKAQLFDVFNGEATGAPMISKCPVNMECRVTQTLNFSEHDVYVAEIIQTHCDDAYVLDGNIAIDKVRPLLFMMGDRSYYGLGEKLGAAWSVGEELINQ